MWICQRCCLQHEGGKPRNLPGKGLPACMHARTCSNLCTPPVSSLRIRFVHATLWGNPFKLKTKPSVLNSSLYAFLQPPHISCAPEIYSFFHLHTHTRILTGMLNFTHTRTAWHVLRGFGATACPLPACMFHGMDKSPPPRRHTMGPCRMGPGCKFSPRILRTAHM